MRWLLLSLGLAGCFPPPFQATGLVTFEIEPRMAFAADLALSVQRVFRVVLGAEAVRTESGQFRVTLDPACPPQRLGHVEQSAPRTVQVCALGLRDAMTARYTLAHELVHAMGFYGHTPCENGGVMAPDFSCWNGLRQPEDYTPGDLDAMRAAGLH